MKQPAAFRKPRSERQQTGRARRTPGLLEHHVQRAVTELLEWDGWRAFRTELTVQRERGRVVGERGQPDYLYLRYATPVAGQGTGLASVIWIEFKRPGEKPRADQLAWHEAEGARGALVLVVDDINQFIQWYRESGLQRR